MSKDQLATPLPTPEPHIEILRTSDALGWRGISARRVTLHPTGEYQHGPSLEDTQLFLSLGMLKGFDYHETGLIWLSRDIYPGSLGIIPRGTVLATRWNDCVAAVNFTLHRAEFFEWAASSIPGDAAQIELLPYANFRDPLIMAVLMEMNREMDSGGLLGPLFAESALELLYVHLLRHYSNRATAHIPEGRGLSRDQRRKLDAYISDHLGEIQSIKELADHLHMSPAHLRRQFKAESSVPLWQYVIERRVQRGAELLRMGTYSLSEIALMTGFADQSHFTRHFRRHYGVPPSLIDNP